MSNLKGKIDFTLFVSATNANPNGDPLNGNRPRTNLDGYGEISAECIKRKIRNRIQDLGERIFVQSEDRSDDGCTSLKERADNCVELKEELEKRRMQIKMHSLRSLAKNGMISGRSGRYSLSKAIPYR